MIVNLSNLLAAVAVVGWRYGVTGQFRTNFNITRFELCRPTATYTIKFRGNVTNENDGQYLSFDATTPIPIDENVGSHCEIETILPSHVAVSLFTIQEKNLCQSTNTYLGEFWYSILRAAQITPKVCPIRAVTCSTNVDVSRKDKFKKAVILGKISRSPCLSGLPLHFSANFSVWDAKIYLECNSKRKT